MPSQRTPPATKTGEPANESGRGERFGVGTEVSAEWANFRLHPPVNFDLTLQEPRYLAIFPYSTATCELAIGGGPPLRTRLRAGSVTFAGPNSAVRLKSVDVFEFLLMSMEPSRLRVLADASNDARPWSARTIIDFRDAGIAVLAQETRRAILADHLTHSTYFQTLADALMVRTLCHLLGEIEMSAGGPGLSPGVLARVLRRIDADLDRTLKIEDLSVEAGLTRSHFSRAFQRVTGEPPQRYIMRRRIARARELLSAADDTIAEIAVRVGFSSQAHLSTVFLKEVGTSPARYRAAFRTGSDAV